VKTSKRQNIGSRNGHRGKISGLSTTKPKDAPVKDWTDGSQFVALYQEGRIRNPRVQVVDGGYALFFCIDKSKEVPLLKARTKTMRVWSTLDTLIRWVSENTELKTLTISLEKHT
jgi:hypothetical protein